MHGSNEWAIAPSFSASGKAMLLSNSHLQWGDIHTYFEVQLTAPGVNSYGAVWVGFPASPVFQRLPRMDADNQQSG